METDYQVPRIKAKGENNKTQSANKVFESQANKTFATQKSLENEIKNAITKYERRMKPSSQNHKRV